MDVAILLYKFNIFSPGNVKSTSKLTIVAYFYLSFMFLYSSFENTNTPNIKKNQANRFQCELTQLGKIMLDFFLLFFSMECCRSQVYIALLLDVFSTLWFVFISLPFYFVWIFVFLLYSTQCFNFSLNCLWTWS